MVWFRPKPRSNLIVSNILDCFNSYILKAWDKLIITMIEMIQKKLTRRYQLKKDGMMSYNRIICPKILDKLVAVGEESCHCLPTYAGNGLLKLRTKVMHM